MNEFYLYQHFGLGTLLLIVIIVFALMIGFSAIMSKWFGVERKGLFFNNYMNDLHKKIDRAIRVIAFISLVVSYMINVNTATDYWFLQPWFILILFVFSSFIMTIMMERKYASNSNAYKVTISEMGFVIVLLLMILIFLWRVV